MTRLPNDAFWVREGRLLAGPYPGSRDRDEAIVDIGGLLDLGAQDFIDLTEEDEGLNPYSELLHELAEARGIETTHARFPIVDVNIPTRERMDDILAALRRSMDSDRVPYVHCWGGTGRTGTVIGCLLLEDGTPKSDVFTEIAHLRRFTDRARRVSPETSEQHDFVSDWAGRALNTRHS